MGRISDTVMAYLELRGWPHREQGDGIVTPVSGSEATWDLLLTPWDDDDQLIVHSLLPVAVAPDRRAEVALYVTRANFGTAVGNLELDLDDGEIRYKTSLDIKGGATLEVQHVDNLVLANIVLADRYLPGIVSVMGGEDPAAAVAAIEG